MKAGIVAASAALVGSVAASALHHAAHAPFHLRGEYAAGEVCTVYTTVYVTALPSIAPNTTVYVHPSPAPQTSTSCTEEEKHSSPAPAPLPPSSSPAPPPAPSSKTEYVVIPPPATVAKPSTSEKAQAPPSSKPAPPPASSSKVEEQKPKPSKPSSSGGGSGSYGGRITPNGKKWAITYTPYAQNGDCKSAGEVKKDIAKISELGYSTIRSYSTDCGVFENVVPACKEHGLKVIYGIFLDANKGPGSQGANEQLDQIIKNAPKDSVAMVIVGNEYIFGHNGDVGSLVSYIKQVKEKLRSAGFPSDIPVTTTEPVNILEQYGSELCSAMDVLAAQVHPFFNGEVVASGAGEFAKSQLEQAKKACPGAAAKGAYITEIGWPTGGQANGAAQPGVKQQKEAIKSIIEEVGEISCIFSFQNDDWKDPGQFGVEQNFGCADIL